MEDDYIFDEVRSYCKENKGVTKDGVKVNISGDGAWKELMVNDEKTGEVLAEKKFYKSEFGALMRDEKYKKYIDIAIEAAYVVNPSTIEPLPEEEDDSDE